MLVCGGCIRSSVAFLASMSMLVGLLVVQHAPARAATADGVLRDLSGGGGVPAIWSPPLADVASMPEGFGEWPSLVEATPPPVVADAELVDGPLEVTDALTGVEAVDAPALPPFDHGGFVEGESSEVLDERTATMKVFDNPDGTQTARLFSEIVHVQDAAGAWVDVDTTLAKGAAGVLAPGATAVDVAFAPSTGVGPVATTADGSRSIAFGAAEAATVAGVALGSAVRYREVWPDTDLVLTALADGVKSELVLASPDAPVRYAFPLVLEGLTPSLDETTNVITYLDADGEVAAHTPPGFMFDADVDEASGEPAMSMGVDFDLVTAGGDGWMLVVTLDEGWLRAPERVFPVTVDPTARWTQKTGASDMYVDNNTGGSGQDLDMLKVGTWNGGTNKRRTFLQWDTSSLAGKQIVSGHLWMVNHHSYSCSNRPIDVHRVTQSWAYSSTWKWPGPTVTSTPITGGGRNFAEGYSSSCPDAWVPIEITEAVQKWASGTWASHGVMIKAGNESDSYGWKKFWSANLREEDYGLPADAYRPYLEVHYNRPPMINSLSPASGATFHALSRTLSVSASDPDGGALQYRFTLSPSSSMTGTGTVTGPWSSSASGALQLTSSSDWNTWVYWQVEVRDGGGLVTRSAARSIRPYNSGAVVSYSSPASGALLHSLTPTLKVATSDSEGDKVYLQYQVLNGSGTVIASSAVTTGLQWQVPAGVLEWNQGYSWRVRRLEILNVSGCSSGAASTDPCVLSKWSPAALRGFRTVNAPPGVPGPMAPGVDEVLTQLPVRFEASTITDPDGDAVRYQFQVAAGDDGQTGRLATSGWLTASGGTVSWTPPAGTLADGGAYSWVVRARDSVGADGSWSAPNGFEVDLRLGRRATFPFDQLGPASVNLVNGNLVVDAGGPSYPTVGPPVGVGFSYNSQTPLLHGLTVRFHEDADTDGQLDAADPLQVRRVDRQVNYDWKSGSPNAAALSGDHWIGRWSGSVRVPPGQDGLWVIEAVSSDPLWIDVAGTRRLTTSGGTGSVASSTIALSSSPTPIEIQFAESTGTANLQLKIRKSTDPSAAAVVIPADWFLPEATVLPGGWSATGLVAGGAGFTSVSQPSDGTVVVIDASGASHQFTAAVGGGWTAPSTLADTTVTRLEDGTVSVTSAAGWVHRFDVTGDLVEVTSPDDRLNPSALAYTFTEPGGLGLPRLTTITDATGRSAQLHYGPAAVCPSDGANGLAAAPAGMLCRVEYAGFGGGFTDLLYVNGHLARIVNPGGEITDLGYDSAGRLVSVRDVLRNDLAAAGTITDLTLATGEANPIHLTQIAYDAANRVASITAPIAAQGTPAADRVVRRYVYGEGSTQVTVDGLATPAGFLQRAVHDPAGRMTAVTDAAGLTTTYEWDDEDRMVATTDPAGLLSTTIFDDAGFAVASHGPAPASWFEGLAPSGSAPGTVPTSGTVHDAGLTGLAASWFDNAGLRGSPVARTLVDNGADWGTGSPHVAVPADGFSGRLTGGIDLPAAGVYTLTLTSGQQGRIYLDDELVYDSWDGTVTAVGVTGDLQTGGHKLSVEYRHVAGSAALQLLWKVPGTSSTTAVPGPVLEPRLGLPYQSTDPDGHVVATGYGDPISGRATSVTTDPAGLALAEVSTYETAGPGSYGRLSSLTLPSGTTTTSYGYHGTTVSGSADHPCVAARGAHQGAGLATRWGPDPARVERYVYDSRGNRVGARIDVGGTAGAWRCSSFDSRGRLVSTTDPSGKTTTIDHSDPTRVVTVYTDSAGATRTTTEQIDWAGRPVSYTDEHGTTHRTVYDRFGRAVATYRRFAGQAESLLVERDFDGAGRIVAIRDHLSGVARQTTFGYDAAGRLETTQRPNDIDTTASYDPQSGHLTGITHTDTAATVLEDWTYRHTAAGRIDVQSGRGQSRVYTYDGAGRLVQALDKAGDPDRPLTADEQATVRQYGYDANSNRCSHVRDVCDGSYTYGVDDRILTSPYATGYQYDERGNIVGWVPSAAAQLAGDGLLRTGVQLEPGRDVHRFDLPVRSAGTLTASLAADSLPSAVTDGRITGTLTEAGQPGDTTTMVLSEVDEDTSVDVDLTWQQDSHQTTVTANNRTVSPGFPSTYQVTPTAPGPLRAEVSWGGVTVTTNRTGTVTAAGTRTVTFEVSGSGTVVVDLGWQQGLTLENLDLQVYDHLGVLRGSSTSLTGDHERVIVSNVSVPYPQSQTWQAKITAIGQGADYQLAIQAPRTPEIDISVTDPTGHTVTPTVTKARPEVVEVSVPDDTAYLGKPYTVTVRSDLSATYNIAATYNELAHALLDADLLDATGTVIDTASGDSGSLSLSATNRVLGDVAVRLTNRSGDLAVPEAAAAWKATTLVGGSAAGSLAVGGSRTVTVSADAAGPLPVGLSWEQSATRRRYSASGVSYSSSTFPSLAVDGVGRIDATVNWTTRDETRSRFGQTVTSDSPDLHSFVVTGSGTLVANPADDIPGAVKVELLDPSGTSKAETTTLAGGQISYPVYGSRSVPRTWTLRVTTVLLTSTVYDLSWSWPAQTNMDVEILDAGGAVLAGSSSTSAIGPDSATYTVTAPATHQVRLRNRDGRAADYTVAVDYPDRAQVRLELRAPDGTLLQTATGTSGRIDGDWTVPDAGDYTLTITNLDPALDVPGYAVSWEAPIDRSPIVEMRLLDGAGTPVATVRGVAHTPDAGPPLALTAQVTAGDHVLEVTRIRRQGSAELTADYPGPRLAPRIVYDANDHATVIDDGITTITETLSPQGRVIARRVTDAVTGDLLEQVSVGYAGPGDNRAYEIVHQDGPDPVTTYVAGPDGLLTIDTAGTAAWPLDDGHGHTLGTAGDGGTYQPNPRADEFGVMPNGQTRGQDSLDWLGGEMRHRTGDLFGLIRMGVRLYDPNLGRFHGVDPVDGGSANTYDYCNADPINCRDLSGEWGLRTWLKGAAIVGGVVGAAACGLSLVCGIVVGAVSAAAVYSAGTAGTDGFSVGGLATSAAVGGLTGGLATKLFAAAAVRLPSKAPVTARFQPRVINLGPLGRAKIAFDPKVHSFSYLERLGSGAVRPHWQVNTWGGALGTRVVRLPVYKSYF
jgi:RHS repeat-associated protein